MKLEIKLTKQDNFWITEVPILDLMTQGKTKKEALEMIQDAVEELLNIKKLDINIQNLGKEYYLSSQNYEALIPMILRRQRQKQGLTLKELADRVGSSSVNYFARYEQGRATPSIIKLLELLETINPKLGLVLKVI